MAQEFNEGRSEGRAVAMAGSESIHELFERRARVAPSHKGMRRLKKLRKDRAVSLYDDGAADCLDNTELKRVVATAHRVLGRKVDVVGMDACLMTMIEVAYQLRDHAQVLVGSEETEPGPGWPHAARSSAI